MKKKVLLFVFICALALSACSDHGYKYAGCFNVEKEFNIRVVDADEQLLKKYGTITHDYDSMLEKAKHNIKEKLSAYRFLDWEKLKDTKTIKRITVPEGEELSDDEKLVFESTPCLNKDGEIGIFPFFEKQDEKYQFNSLTHELLHSLITNYEGETRIDNLDEGVIDYYTLIVTGDASAVSYPLEYAAASWLVYVFGDESILKADRAREIEDIIDEASEEGMGKKLNYSLAIINTRSKAVDVKRLMNVQVDILCHVSVAKDKKDVDKNINLYDLLCVNLTGEHLDTGYFDKLLNTD